MVQCLHCLPRTKYNHLNYFILFHFSTFLLSFSNKTSKKKKKKKKKFFIVSEELIDTDAVLTDNFGLDFLDDPLPSYRNNPVTSDTPAALPIASAAVSAELIASNNPVAPAVASTEVATPTSTAAVTVAKTGNPSSSDKRAIYSDLRLQLAQTIIPNLENNKLYQNRDTLKLITALVSPPRSRPYHRKNKTKINKTN